jgi:RIO kinase 1
MASSLEHLLAEGIISEVLGRLQSGKEAEVFVVRSGGRVVVAKVYKDRAHRSFKNNAEYKEGRAVRNSRSQRAMDRGSKFGKATAEDAWKSAEVDAMYRLHAANVRVPAPVMFIDGVLLMELVLGDDGRPAPRLIDTPLTAEQANSAYRDMLTQLVRMLSCDLIHGDLSPYNVLWAEAGPTIIDFPQIVSAAQNSSSERFFLRDAENTLGHLARIDRSLGARRGDAQEIWRAYVRRELTPDFVPSGRAVLPQRPPPRPPEASPGRALDAAPGRGNGDNASRMGGAGRGNGDNASRTGGAGRGNGDNASRMGGAGRGNGDNASRMDGAGRGNGDNASRAIGSGSGRGHAHNAHRGGGSAGGTGNGNGNGNGNASPRPNGRSFPEQRRPAKAPEVLFARPRNRAAEPQSSAPQPQAAPPAERADGRGNDSASRSRGRRPRFR